MDTGQTVGGYRLESQVGGGSFGDVWHARSLSDPARSAALKFARKTPNADIKKEMESWKKASGHPHVVKFHEFFLYRIPDDVEESIVLVSEYLPDGSLFDRLRQGLPAIEEAVRIMRDVLGGLDHLHNNRICHRDLKPGNILMDRGRAKVGDFGSARLLDDHPSSHRLNGTPHYMAPEAFFADRLPPVDIWSAGVTLYQLVAGYLPFEATDLDDLRRMIRKEPPRPLPSHIPQLITNTIHWALTKDDPARKRPTAAEMANMLTLWLDHPSVSADDYATQRVDATIPVATSIADDDGSTKRKETGSGAKE